MAEEENESAKDSPEIERLNRRTNELYQRVIDLERRLRSTNDRLKILRNSFAVLYAVIIVLVFVAAARWLL